ncbi:MAG: tripartite tricarboxylate transporter permease [Gemmatimonadota bacterium]
MPSVLEAAWEGLLFVLSWPNVLYPLAGTLAAMVVALLPGISGAALMALAIPLTFGWAPEQVMLLFGALVGGATFMGSVTAILLNIPGSGPSAATLLDGYPMARQGQAKTALAASATASALGSTFGIIVLIALLPVVTRVVPLIGPPEFLMLAVWGLLTIGTLLRGSVSKGLAAAGLGLMLSFIGFEPRTAELRYTFGTLFLQDGLSVVPVFLGVFALAEVIELGVSRRGTISGRSSVEALGGSVAEGIRAVFRHGGLFMRSSLIGTIVGMIPGLGGTVAGFVAYGAAARTSPNGRFGQGDIRGVIAPEAATDAKDGGSLLPALALGIPANAATAVMLAAMTLHGIRPGQELMTERLPLTFAIIWSLFIANWVTSLLGLSVVRPLARLTVVRTDRLIPFVLAVSILGAVSFRGQLADVWVACAFGVVGYLMKKYGWSRLAFVMALVLGPLLESNLRLSWSLHQLERINFWTRPSVLVLGLLMVLTMVPAWRQRARA